MDLKLVEILMCFYRTANEIGGVTASILNSTLFQVSNSGVDTYNIQSSSQAAGNSIGGGDLVYASIQQKI